MVSTYLQGGLGNYMFQIAVADSLAKDNNAETTFFVDIAVQVHKNILSYSDNIFRNITLVKGNPTMTNVYNEPKFTYNKIPYVYGLLLVGYFQTEKYFNHHREHILDLFGPREEDLEYIKNKYGELLENKTCK